MFFLFAAQQEGESSVGVEMRDCTDAKIINNRLTLLDHPSLAYLLSAEALVRG